MESIIDIRIAAPPDVVFALAAAVEDWPRILPHYRWVKRLADTGPRRVVEMARQKSGTLPPARFCTH